MNNNISLDINSIQKASLEALYDFSNNVLSFFTWHKFENSKYGMTLDIKNNSFSVSEEIYSDIQSIILKNFILYFEQDIMFSTEDRMNCLKVAFTGPLKNQESFFKKLFIERLAEKRNNFIIMETESSKISKIGESEEKFRVRSFLEIGKEVSKNYTNRVCLSRNHVLDFFDKAFDQFISHPKTILASFNSNELNVHPSSMISVQNKRSSVLDKEAFVSKLKAMT